jgi:hypothetical protein
MFIVKYNSFFDMKMIIIVLWITIISLSSCSEDVKNVEDKVINDTITKAKPITSEDTLPIRNKIETVEDQVNQLERIIGINRTQLEKYERMIAEGDTFDLKGLPQYVEDLKEAIKLKEERLEKLKKK